MQTSFITGEIPHTCCGKNRVDKSSLSLAALIITKSQKRHYFAQFRDILQPELEIDVAFKQ